MPGSSGAKGQTPKSTKYQELEGDHGKGRPRPGLQWQAHGSHRFPFLPSCHLCTWSRHWIGNGRGFKLQEDCAGLRRESSFCCERDVLSTAPTLEVGSGTQGFEKIRPPQVTVSRLVLCLLLWTPKGCGHGRGGRRAPDDNELTKASQSREAAS